MEKRDLEQIQAKYRIVCRKCGGENVLVDYEGEHHYSEHTVSGATLSLRCPDCDDEGVVLFL